MFLNNITLFLTMLRNIRSERINREMIGHRITNRIGPITRNDIYSYVEATLDNPVRYNGENCAVPPFYLSRLLYPMFKYFLVNKELKLNLLKLVHGQQTIEWLGNIHEGDIIDVEMSIDDIKDSPAGEMIDLKTVASVCDSIIAEAHTVFIIRSRHKKRSGRRKERVYDRELFRKKFRTVKQQPLQYAKVSGDSNFIHTSPFLARLAGLPGTVMHGVCIAAMTANSLLDEVCNGDMTRMKGISMRFATPVLPGDEITIIGYDSGENDRIVFNAVNSLGKYVLKNGEYRFTPQN
ncbi:MAG TPA: MaoC/PaaZ C-terminal domain-containing protein [Spirochaetota bacterium]|nr:MaoC/PaaZ C-terminal domain-containing protein [Spirochaetota bacterium]HPF06360.1 MaoC/PaaZ C-terminal domain-containing protein [Spirochaetota bacterium]HPJ43019.1 MaoC/PaaZ C-terminal domain-containing protein [Spirochaetota bacterium]HPR38644.1 MaoC/PaaZ C-terminal domain-containing protein [Spirochaetota bacterium]HRX48713.1 MaoC/PaaZ C-terminal domain-containing protein [Spirochaetota bacterium]